MKESTKKIFCEQHRCTISISGCVARQKRATFGLVWHRGYGPGNNGGRQIPYDPVCKECEQGKEVMNMIDGKKLVAECFGRAPDTEKEKQDPENGNAIPYGYCHCGCGQKTTISEKTDRVHGHVKGEPIKWLQGHATRKRKTGDRNKPGRKPGKKYPKPVKENNVCIMDTSYPLALERQELKNTTASGRKLLIDFEALADAGELREMLKKRAAENLRTVDAQATWELVQALRNVVGKPAPVLFRSWDRVPDLGPGMIRLADYPGAEIEIEEEMD